MANASSTQTSVTLAGTVYQRLRQDIVDGELAPGCHLTLAALRERYGVGLSPLREALSRLASDTFVIGFENRGYRVAGLSKADLLDITHTRILIERDSLAMAINLGDDTWEANIVASHHRLARLDARLPDLDERSLDAWESANRAFHDALVAACGSHWLQRFRRLLQDQSKRYRRLAVQKSANQRAVMVEHTEIMQACLKRDVPAAQDLVEGHIRATTDSLLSDFEGHFRELERGLT